MSNRARTVLLLLSVAIAAVSLTVAAVNSRQAQTLAEEVTRQGRLVRTDQELAATAQTHRATAVACAQREAEAKEALERVAVAADAECERAQAAATRTAGAAGLFARALALLEDGPYDVGLLLAAEAARLSDEALARQYLYRVLSLHNPYLLAYDPDGSLYREAFAGDGERVRPGITRRGNTITLEEPDSDAVRCEINAGEGEEGGGFTAYDLHPERRLLATGRGDGEIRMWDTADCADLGALPVGGGGAVWALRFSPDGRFLVAAGEGHPLLLWELAAEAAVALPGNGEPVVDSPLAFGDAGRYLAVETAGALLLWDLAERQLLASPALNSVPALIDLVIEPGGGAVVALALDGSVQRWTVGAAGLSHVAAPLPVSWEDDPRDYGLADLALSPDGRHLALYECERELLIAGVCLNGLLRVWRLEAGTPVPIISEETGEYGYATTVIFSDDGRRLWSRTDSGGWRLWDLAPADALATELRGAQAAALSTTTELQKLVFHDGTLWDLAQGRPVEQFPFPITGTLEAVAWTADGGLFAVAESDADGRTTVSRRQAGSWELLNRFTLPAGSGRVLFGPDLRVVLSWPEDPPAVLYDAQSGDPLGTLRCPIGTLTHPADPALAYSCRYGALLVTDSATGEVVTVVQDTPDRALSPDGRTVATGDETLQLRDARTGQEKGPTVEIGDGYTIITGLAFSADGAWVAVADAFGGVQIRDVADGTLVHEFRPSLTPSDWGYSDSPYGTTVSFTPDGQQLLSTGTYQADTLWDVGVAALTERVCRIAGRNLSEGEWERFVGDEGYRETCGEPREDGKR